MVNKIKLVLLIIFSTFFYSCFQSNSISFCVDTQEIKSCNSKGINRIYIANDTTNENYRIEWKKKGKAPTSLKLNSIQDGYIVTSGWENKELKSTKLTLMANSKYTLERSQGDANSYKIKLNTDEQGFIRSSDKTNCN